MAKKMRLCVCDDAILNKTDDDEELNLTPVNVYSIIEAVEEEVLNSGDYDNLEVLLKGLFKIAVESQCSDIIEDLVSKGSKYVADTIDDDIEKGIMKMVPKIIRMYKFY